MGGRPAVVTVATTATTEILVLFLSGFAKTLQRRFLKRPPRLASSSKGSEEKEDLLLSHGERKRGLNKLRRLLSVIFSFWVYGGHFFCEWGSG